MELVLDAVDELAVELGDELVDLGAGMGGGGGGGRGETDEDRADDGGEAPASR